MVPDRIERDILIDAPIERVWAVITEPEHLQRWWADAGAEVDLRPGGAYILRERQWGEARGRVEAVDPPHRLAYRWSAHHARDEDPGEGTSTLVEFTLAPEADGTRLRVVETGFASLSTSAEAATRNHDDNVGGWREVLRMVDEYATRVAA
ncbi:MAG: SRPBCC domain-containing protein [Solirubrobacteraceae bacterium]